MLRHVGVQPYWMLPPSEYELTDQQYYGLYSSFPKLPLEVFDNTDFDCRSVSKLFVFVTKNQFCMAFAHIKLALTDSFSTK